MLLIEFFILQGCCWKCVCFVSYCIDRCVSYLVSCGDRLAALWNEGCVPYLPAELIYLHETEGA